MTGQNFKSGLWILVKGVIVSFVAVISMAIGGAITSTLGIPAPTLPKEFNPGTMLLYRMLLGSPFYILLGLFFRRLNQKKSVVFLLSLFFYFVAVILLNTIEASFFTTMVSMPFNLILGAIESILVALCISLLFSSKTPDPSFFRTFTAWVSQFKTRKLGLRIVAAWLSFIIIYFAMGMLIAPIVTPYYKTGSFGLKLPSIQAIIPLQLGRGALILLFCLPLIALWKTGRRSFFIWFGLILFFKDVALGILLVSWFPWVLRIVHGLELTADSFLLAGAYSLLLIRRGNEKVLE